MAPVELKGARNMRRLALVSVLTALVCTALAGSAMAASTKTWHVKVTNLTTHQPMSAPVWAVHNKKLHLWRKGQLASSALIPIAEDAVVAPMVGYLTGNKNVFDFGVEGLGTTPPTPILPGASREFDVNSKGGARYLSMAWMLVNTNDAFTGTDSYALDQGTKKKKHGGHAAAFKTRTLNLIAYDAGSENNNQSCAFIPGPTCNSHNVRDPSAQPIAKHPGITGGDIAADAWDTSSPVATVEITRTK